MAEFLRVFVITWDPLELDDARPPAFATANSDELCVYVPFWSLGGLAERRGTDVAEVLGWLGGCAVVTAVEVAADLADPRGSQASCTAEEIVRHAAGVIAGELCEAARPTLS